MSQKTKLIQCFIPSLTAGVYDVAVTQTITKDNAAVPFAGKMSKSLQFAVDAARFTLNPSDIYSVYPPANQFSNVTGSLPHIVFSRRTLPWERTIDGLPPLYLQETTPAGKRSPKVSQPVPWMALILFTEEEMKDLHIIKNTVGSLVQGATEKDITRPEINSNGKGLRLMDWEKDTDGCYTIDINAEQFRKYMPSIESLSYLAHAKEVSIENKDKEGITDINANGTGVFSVIVGNRMPVRDKQHTAMLVSLEGFASYLTPGKGKPPAKAIPAGNKVRMAVLANWNFNNAGSATFLELVNGLEHKPLKVTKTKSKELAPYFDSGYVAMEHLTRNGVKTVSWYHGPFIPQLSPGMSNNISFSTADAALRYDKTTGIFDISFAAAWQLGRMLALQNQGFSTSILNWRISQKQDAVNTGRAGSINTIINDSSNLPLREKVIKFLNKGVAINNTTTDVAVSNNNEIPKEIQHFLGNLYRLNGVPFSYLVPHEYYLEKQHDGFSGSLACFYVDPNWIEAMLDGALSIGRLQHTDTILNTAMSGGFIPEFTQALTPETKTSPPQLNVTGFLLRSDLISGWRGIEIEAFGSDKDKPLQALRLERIDQDIFLGIFNGNVTSIVITQPYEGLHFGLKMDSNGTYVKNLKNEQGDNKETTDGTADLNKELKEMVTDGVLDVGGIAGSMKQKLMKNNWFDADFTSAEFAYQMVDSPVKQTINITVQ